MTDSYPAQGESYPRRLPRSHRTEDRPRRRGRKVLIVLLILLLVLVAALVVADRYAVGFAEREIATRISQETARQGIKTGPPDVTVNGTPFLTQVIAGNYQSIVIVLRDVEAPVPDVQATVALPELHVDARDIAASINTLRTGQGQVTAGTVNGTATISYDSVVKLIDQPGIRLREEGGKLLVDAPLQFLGQQFTVHGAANVKIEGAEVALSFSNVTVDGLPEIPLARLAVQEAARQIGFRVPLPELPFNLQVQEVTPRPEGLAVRATAKDVPIS
ncbi:LmeA family phospholipid-binding protein [Micromonospora sp. NPDC004704]